MQLTRRIELVFPRSGQVVAIQVPAEIFEKILRVNLTLLSFLSRSRACVPGELMTKLHPQ